MNLTEKEKENITLMKVMELFMRLGIRSVNMDDIARHLGISKKTLYKYAANKKDLVKKCVQLSIDMEKNEIVEITDLKGNAIDQLFAINKMISHKLANLHPSVMYDIQKYHPEAWQLMDQHKCQYVQDCIVDNIKEGQEEGLYRDNINADIVSNIYVSIINSMMDPEIFPSSKYALKDVHREIARYHLKGIASEKGVKYIRRLFEKTHTDIV